MKQNTEQGKKDGNEISERQYKCSKEWQQNEEYIIRGGKKSWNEGDR